MATNPIYQIGEVPGEVLKGCKSYRVGTTRGNLSIYVVRRAGGWAHYAQSKRNSKIWRQFAGFAPWMTNKKIAAAVNELRRKIGE